MPQSLKEGRPKLENHILFKALINPREKTRLDNFFPTKNFQKYEREFICI